MKNEEEFIENLNTKEKERIYDLGFKRGRVQAQQDELEFLEEFKARLEVWKISGYIKESIEDRIKEIK